MESAFYAKFATTLLKVFIFADSTKELSRLTAIVRSNSSLEFGGGSLDRDVLLDQLEDLEDAKSVVILEHSSVQYLQHSSANDLVVDRAVRIVPTKQAGFGDAIAAVKEADSAIRAVLPAWASSKEIHAALETVNSGLIVIRKSSPNLQWKEMSESDSFRNILCANCRIRQFCNFRRANRKF